MTKKTWSIGWKLAGGFAAVVALAVVIAAIGVFGMRRVVAEEERLLSTHAAALHDAREMQARFERKIAEARGFFFTRDEHFVGLMREARGEFLPLLAKLEKAASTDEARRRLAEIARSEAEHQAGLDLAIEMLRSGENVAEVGQFMRTTLAPHREQIFQLISAFVTKEAERLAEAKLAAERHADAAQRLVLVATLVAVALAAGLALAIARGLSRQVGTAIRHVQGSSSELRAAATEQANGAKEQSSTMSEIATTVNELLATSRQIAERAQRVSEVADRTAGSGRSGGEAMSSAIQSSTTIRRQIDAVVGHMTELGRRSQQIGMVLEIINELAEQTNIIAINATIEAAGATDAGRRFGVVADEIRKLANRMTGSTKEIRALVDEVRSATHTTIMATESGSKSVDAGMIAFEQVAGSFQAILGLVRTTTEAARDIELSTKQQATAVEQVNVAISGLLQSTRDGEASSSRVLHTASQLSELASSLTRVVQPRATG